MAGAASPKLEKPPSNQDGGPALQDFGVARSDVALVSSMRRSLYHQSGKSWTSSTWRCFIDCSIHKNGNGTLSSSRFGASETLQGAQSPCALCRGDRAPLARGNPSRGWRPRQALGVIPCRGNPCRDPLQAWEPLQARRAWSLAKTSLKTWWALAGRPVVPWFPLC